MRTLSVRRTVINLLYGNLEVSSEMSLILAIETLIPTLNFRTTFC